MEFAIKIGGMSCNHCKKSVESALECLDRAENIAVTIGSAYLRASCSKEDIKDAVEELGFDVISIDEQ